MSSRLCPFCMRMSEAEICPHCGKHINYAGSPAHLPAGYVVSGKHPYVLGAALGQGGFGITYIALDMVTSERVAIKEYYPTYCSTRTDGVTVTAYSNQEEVYLKGKERFLDEARTLKSLSDLPNIVNVLDFFEGNNTAYLVMEFLDGSSLKDYAMKNGKFPAQKFLSQIKPLMEDIHKMHERGVIHRDIAPDNIILLPDGQMKLIDFGSARSFVGDRSMTVVVKKGFAPLEQYLSKGAAASTDVYALAATIYYCITGTVPMDSAERQDANTSLPTPSSLGADLTSRQEKALAKALALQQKARTQSVQEFLMKLSVKEPEKPKPKPEKPIRTKPEKPVKVKKEKPVKPKKEKTVKPKKEKTVKQKPKKSEEDIQTSKKKALRIAAAILVIITVFGFVLTRRSPPEAPEQLEALIETTESPSAATGISAETTPAEPTADEPAWKKNVLMADLTYDEDHSKFWNGKASMPGDKIIDFYSKRPIFNTEIPRNKVTDVFFLDSVSTAPEDAYDVSASQDKSVLAWTKKNSKGALDLYIAGEGGVNGSEACRVLFIGYAEMEAVHFNNCFFTDDTQDMSSMFEYCIKLTTVDLECLNTSSVTNMNRMFHSCDQVTSLNLSSFDTSNVTNMGYMLSNCEQLASLDLSNFDTTNVVDMRGMFSMSKKITALDLSGFDTAKVTDMSYMFTGCTQLKSLDLSNFDTARVTDMRSMFYRCEQLTSLDLGNFDTCNVTNMDQMFWHCNQLTSLDLSNFDTAKVTSYNNFMDDGQKVNGRPWKELFTQNNGADTSISANPTTEEPAWKKNILMADTTFDADYAKFWEGKSKVFSNDIYDYFSKRPVFNTDIPRSKVTDVFFLDTLAEAPENAYDVSANQDGSVLVWTEKNRKSALNLYIAGEGGVNGVEACRSLFYGYKELQSVNFNNSFFTDTTQDMSNMFAYCKKLTTIDLNGLKTASATNMSHMFSSCDLLTALDLSSFNTSNVTDMSFMFSSCPKLKSLDISSFDTSNVENMSYMFSYLSSMTSFDVSHFVTSKTVYMGGLFAGCSNEKFTSLDLRNFDTSNVTNMNRMFSDCRWITALDLRNFDTSNVTNMSAMFSYCRRLTSLDLSSFDTSKVTSMNSMFEMCSLLPVLEISHFNTQNVIDMGFMFYKCGYLKQVDVTQLDVSSLEITTNMFYGCDKLPLDYKKIGGNYIWSS